MSDDPNQSDGHKIERGLYAVAATIERLAQAFENLHEDLRVGEITFFTSDKD